MSSSPNTNIGTTYQISNTKMVAPTEGPRALVAFLNFTNSATAATVDLTQQTQPPAQLSVIQGVFVDNHAGTVDILLQQVQTAQILIIKAGQQAYVPVLAAATPVFNFSGANNASPGIVVPVYFYNVPIAPLVLGTNSIGASFNSGNMLVQDTAAENSLAALTALITNAGSGNGLDVNVITGGGGAGTLPTYKWNRVLLGSSGGTLYTPGSGLRFYVNAIHILLDPNIGTIVGNTWSISDGASVELSGVMTGAGSGPPYSYTVPISALRAFDADNMGWLSSTVNNTLSFSWGTAVSGNNYVNFSTLIGDHP